MSEPTSRAIAGALVLAALGGCTEYGYIQEVNRDVFQQVRRNTVDILMVVDNSCSMVDEQEKLAVSFDNFISAFDGVDVDWHIGAVTTDMSDPEQSGRLLGGTDELLLQSAEGRTLDRVAWDRNWAVADGASLQLDANVVLATGNDDRQAWCLASETYGDGDQGTPGAPNAACSGDTPSDPLPDPTSDAPIPPTVNSILISEFMANPEAVTDAQGEWVELRNLSGDDLDLSGCLLTDGSENASSRGTFVFPDGAVIEAGGYAVVARSLDTSANGGVPADFEAVDQMTLANPDLFISPASENPDEQFAELVSVGAGGVGIEMGLEAAYKALSADLTNGDNAGFLREGANLSLIFVSDEDDFSPRPVDEYLRYFMDLKGDEAYRYPGIVTISAVVGTDPPSYDGQPSCESDAGFAMFGGRYVDLASRTRGVLESICDEDFAPIASELGLLASGLELEFVLSEPANEETLVVKLYESQDEASFIAELVKDEQWSYYAPNNSVRFEPDQVPPSETVIVVEYEVLGRGAARQDSGSAQ